jgi:hypothetical protein
MRFLQKSEAWGLPCHNEELLQMHQKPQVCPEQCDQIGLNYSFGGKFSELD